MRMLLPARTVPSSTLQPATFPTAPILKVCSTSAVPVSEPSALFGGGRMWVHMSARTSSSRSYTIEYSLISTLHCSAASRVGRAATELKPSTTAFETDASMTSSAVMAPAPERSTRVRTRSRSSDTSIDSSDEQSASADPCTSLLTTKSSVLVGSSEEGPDRNASRSAVERDAKSFDARASRCSCWRTSAIWRAFVSSPVTMNASPAAGRPLRPTSSTAVDGPDSLTSSLRSSCSLRTRPHCAPATTMSPTRSVPFCTSAVATAPWPSCCRASTTTPAAARSGLALRSRISACSCTCSSSLSRPVRATADTSADNTSPPNSSRTTSYSSSCVLTCDASAAGLSILLTATTIGTPAAFAALIDDTVCSLTPSSPATTRMTISVTLAPRARISAKAAWPGVSMKVSVPPPSTLTRDAPIACVMPPASPAATSVVRSASSSEVFPWSTCPMTVTTGGRRTSDSGGSSSSTTPHEPASPSSPSSAPSPARDTSAPNASATASAVSASRD
mmetsp:Transcript_16285/g.49376  ORF Transcript_16285/g.49376 Transcript_16285/m.49376 type:complete len:505 (-) Transcript_16285:542-2056(-)